MASDRVNLRHMFRTNLAFNILNCLANGESAEELQNLMVGVLHCVQDGLGNEELENLISDSRTGQPPFRGAISPEQMSNLMLSVLRAQPGSEVQREVQGKVSLNGEE